MEIKNCKFLKLFGINGIVLYPFILYADKFPSRTVRSHEKIHVNQIRSMGVLKFYLSYVGEYAQGRLKGLSHDQAYREISFEKEAYRDQDKIGLS